MYSQNDWRSYELYHHGIMGQKWGIRRYQNADGSLTEEGRQHYGYGEKKDSVNTKSKSTKMTSSLKAIENGGIEYDDPIDRVKAVTGDCTFARIDYKKYKNDPEYKKEVNEVADLGYAAVNKMCHYGDEDYSDLQYYMEKGLSHDEAVEKVKNANREWFLFEDQTIGMPMVAGLIKDGYTADQVGKMMDIVSSCAAYDEVYEELYYQAPVFNIMEGNWGNELKRFAEYCEEELKNK